MIENETKREKDFREKFPERWLCLYCQQEGVVEQEDCMVERDDIVHHLKVKHGYPDDSNWEYVTNRLLECGAY